MPKEAILFSILILSSSFSHSYGLVETAPLELQTSDQIPTLTSGIIDIDSSFFEPSSYKRYIVFGDKPIIFNQNHKTIYEIESNNGFFKIAILPDDLIPNLLSRGFYVIEDFQLDFHSEDIDESDISRIGKITNSKLANSEYGVDGKGINIAIVDTGVDFSNPNIQHSLARDYKRHPIMLDPDGQGIILTNATFIANIDKNGIIRSYEKKLPDGITSNVYLNKDGVFLNISKNGKGTDIQIYNSFFPQAGSTVVFNGTLSTDMKIGQDNRNYIVSKSGVYHLGVIYQGALQGSLARIQVVPVLVVDAIEPGVYDTIIPDLSTSWEDYTRFDLKSGQKPDYDFDFTDEKPIILGSGKEFLVYDSNGDGKADYSAGTIGAQVLDVYSAVQNKTTTIHDSIQAINGTLLPSLDPKGNFFGIMTDFIGHGTSSTASITSNGEEQYDIYNNTKKYAITGVAPGAKIIPIKALWFGDTVYAWLWAAGFDNNGTKWEFRGNPRADIISNSWGVSSFPSFNAAPGLDLLSLLHSALVTPQSLDEDYHGVVIVTSAGNSGHGYGTIGLPNASPFGISVGATTNNVFVGYGPFNKEPRFGNNTLHYNHVVDFSSRGPGIIGDPKPDLMSIGAYGFTPSNVLKTEKNSKLESFSLFGGTSMAAPLVSGSTALLIENLQKKSIDYDPFTIKNILMSTASDLQNDPFTQGSGLVNVYDALRYVNHEDGMFVVYNNATYYNVKDVMSPALEKFNTTSIGFDRFEFPSSSNPTTQWFAGHLIPGERTSAEFTVHNPTNSSLNISIKPQTLSLIQKNILNGTTIPRQQDSIYNKTDTFAPNYVKLSDVASQKELGDFFDEKPIPDDSSLMILNLNFGFDSFMNKTADTYADDLKISSLYLYDWIDKNNDTDISSNELSLINRGGSWGTVQELRVSQPHERFEGIPLVGVYPVPTRHSYWLGDTKQNSTSFDYTLSASYYKKQNLSSIWVDNSEIIVPPSSNSKVIATIVVPDDLQTGVYQGFLTFEGQKHIVNSPVSFVVKQPINETDTTLIVSGKDGNDVTYGSGYVKGAFDMTNRYMAGDWRQYYFDVQNENINSAAIEMSWKSSDTNFSVFVMDPKGRIVQTNMPSGVFGHFLGWPSLDWLGNSIFSQGGGFFPVKNKNNTSTVLYVPINQTGTYSLLAHSTLFGGESTTEPVTIIAKFLNISTDKLPTQSELIDAPALNFTSTVKSPEIIVENKSSEIIQEKIISQESSSNDFTGNNSLFIGLGIGIGIGIAIGVGILLVIRQKSPN